EHQIGLGPCLVAEAIGWTYGKEQVLRATVLLVAQQLGELFRGKLASAGVEQDQHRPGTAASGVGQFQKRLFGGHLVRFGSDIAGGALKVLRRKRAYG